VGSVSSVAREYYVYIMASERQTFYTGLTSNLVSRIWQHKNKLVPGFTAKYDCTKLVYYEVTNDVWEAIGREKQIKGQTCCDAIYFLIRSQEGTEPAPFLAHSQDEQGSTQVHTETPNEKADRMSSCFAAWRSR
jgi:putative endonuclease